MNDEEAIEAAWRAYVGPIDGARDNRDFVAGYLAAQRAAVGEREAVELLFEIVSRADEGDICSPEAMKLEKRLEAWLAAERIRRERTGK